MKESLATAQWQLGIKTLVYCSLTKLKVGHITYIVKLRKISLKLQRYYTLQNPPIASGHTGK